MKPKNTICLWFDKDAHEAAQFYAATFPDSKVTAVHKAPSDYPGGKRGDALTVEFAVLGIPCVSTAVRRSSCPGGRFSFQIATENQEETDRYWNVIVGNGGKESACPGFWLQGPALWRALLAILPSRHAASYRCACRRWRRSALSASSYSRRITHVR